MAERHAPAGSAPASAVGPDRRRTLLVTWLPRAYLVVAAALVPWTVYLAVSLPARSTSLHYRGTWVGFDIVLVLVLARIGWFAAHRDPRVVLTAAAGTALLAADAWFDVTTAAPGSAHLQAVVSAVLLELPGAALCSLLARRGLAVLTTPPAELSPAPTTETRTP